MSKRIIIIEDEAIIAEDLKSTLTILGYKIVGHAMNGDKALDLFATVQADLILLDINIKGTLSGIDLAKVIRKNYDVPFVFLTSFSDKKTLSQVKTTIPYGYILKPYTENDLRSNIELALYKFEMELATKSKSKEYIETKLEVQLTQREYDVLICFDQGCSYKEIATKLIISVNTVKSYQKKIFSLLEVSSRHELMALLNN